MTNDNLPAELLAIMDEVIMEFQKSFILTKKGNYDLAKNENLSFLLKSMKKAYEANATNSQQVMR